MVSTLLHVLLWVGPAHYAVGQFLDFAKARQNSVVGEGGGGQGR